VNELYPFEDHYLDLDGLNYHYLDEGQGAPVVLVHGNPTWSFYYRGLIKGLSANFRSIAPDHIGCGKSDKPDAARYDYTLASRVDDLERFIDHLNLPRVSLVLHDWGGMIGMAWAARHPEQVDRLVILNSAAFGLPEGKRFPWMLSLARTPLLGEFLVRGCGAFGRGANRYCVTRKPLSPAVARGYLEPYNSWRNRIAVHRFITDIPINSNDRAHKLVEETEAALPGLREKPMMLCWGMRDFIFDEHFLNEWQRRFPDAEAHRFEDSGHYVLEDAGEEILPLVKRFLMTSGPEAGQ
jgi:pimeloyl-ACP methyl ester carboxylesterase